MMKLGYSIIIFIIFSTALLCYAQNVQPRGNIEVYLIDRDILESNKEKIKLNDEHVLPAFENLMKQAASALTKGPFSVTYKDKYPPSGDKHDYMSLGPYWWPDPSKPDGLPYIRKDGIVNPEVYEYKDKQQLLEMCLAVKLTALAYYLTEEKKYAEYAVNILKIWFINEETRMNPHLNFGQSIPGISDGRSVGIIEGRHFCEVIDAIGMIKTSGFYDDETSSKMKQWFEEYFKWLTISELGKGESNAENNHGSWYDVQVSVISLFLGKTEFAEKIISEARFKRIDNQIKPDGSQPNELVRTRSLSYSSFNLEALFTLARLGKYTGIDLWNFKSGEGVSLKKAFDFLLPYYLSEKTWPYEQIRNFEFERSYALLLQAARNFNDDTYAKTAEQLYDQFKEDLSIILFKK